MLSDHADPIDPELMEIVALIPTDVGGLDDVQGSRDGFEAMLPFIDAGTASPGPSTAPQW